MRSVMFPTPVADESIWRSHDQLPLRLVAHPIDSTGVIVFSNACPSRSSMVFTTQCAGVPTIEICDFQREWRARVYWGSVI